MFGFNLKNTPDLLLFWIFLSCFWFASYMFTSSYLILFINGGKFVLYPIFFNPQNSKSRPLSIILEPIFSAYFRLFPLILALIFWAHRALPPEYCRHLGCHSRGHVGPKNRRGSRVKSEKGSSGQTAMNNQTLQMSLQFFFTAKWYFAILLSWSHPAQSAPFARPQANRVSDNLISSP